MQQSTALQKSWQKIATVTTTLIMAMFGFSGFAAADAIITTGPGSSNTINRSTNDTCDLTNNNTLRGSATSNQDANTGDATVSDNTNAGSATTGDATNNNQTNADVNIANGDGGCGCPMVETPVADSTVTNTGPHSNNTINNDMNTSTTVENNNNISLSSVNNQDANTGDAAVSDNTNAGSATTGDATNNNHTSFIASLVNGSQATAQAAATADIASSCPVATSAPISTNGPVTGSHSGGSVSAPLASPRISGSSYSNSPRAGFYAPQNNYRSSVPAFQAQFHPAPATTQVTTPTAVQPVATQSPVRPLVAPAQTQSAISNTGPNSTNTINATSNNNVSVTNNNNVSFTSANYQTANTGNAQVSYNTTTGSGDSGNAANTNGTSGLLSANN